jgi:hypothetical protein
MKQQVETWRQTKLSTVTAKMIIYHTLIEGELEVPRNLARRVHDLYFSPQYPEFEPRILIRLSTVAQDFRRQRRRAGSKWRFLRLWKFHP